MQIINILKQKCNDIDLTDFWIALVYIFNTFDEAIIYYSSMGIISTCGCMISSNIDSNIFGGL